MNIAKSIIYVLMFNVVTALAESPSNTEIVRINVRDGYYLDGPILNGQMHGKFLITKGRYQQVLFFKNGKPQGKGKLYRKIGEYDGELDDIQRRHGFGHQKLERNSERTGEWLDDEKSGLSIYHDKHAGFRSGYFVVEGATIQGPSITADGFGGWIVKNNQKGKSDSFTLQLTHTNKLYMKYIDNGVHVSALFSESGELEYYQRFTERCEFKEVVVCFAYEKGVTEVLSVSELLIDDVSIPLDSAVGLTSSDKVGSTGADTKLRGEYSGQLNNAGQRQGFGRLKTSDAGIYFSEWENDHQVGLSYYQSQDGHVQKALFIENGHANGITLSKSELGNWVVQTYKKGEAQDKLIVIGFDETFSLKYKKDTFVAGAKVKANGELVYYQRNNKRCEYKGGVKCFYYPVGVADVLANFLSNK